MKSLTYLGSVLEDGTIKLPKRVRSEVGQLFNGKQIKVTFAKQVKHRTNPQLRYYFAVIVQSVAEALQELGNPINPSDPADLDIVHNFLKERFLEPTYGHDANGERIILWYSTKNKSTSEMMDYFAKIQQFSAEFLNKVIPDPGQQAEFFNQ